MKTIFIDCSMGCAGDMLTAALLELLPDRKGFLERMNAALGGKAVLSAAADRKCGIRGTHVSVRIGGAEEGEEHPAHSHHSHSHSGISEILSFLDGVALPAEVRENAKAVYRLLAEAESTVHGTEVDQIHFHEVGSLDALADVLSVCELFYELAPERILASAVNVGGGITKCAHGILPVPAPATEQLLRGIPVYSGRVKSELCTPTGAALLKHFVCAFGDLPQMTVMAAGYGTGKKDFEVANVVRVLLGETEGEQDRILELSCNLDDMTGEELGFAMQQLLEQGALDVFFTPIGMKKSRPGTMLTCLCRPEQREEMLRCIFGNTTTLGVRETVCSRAVLNRSIRTVETEYGPVRIKTADGFGVHREKIEYEDAVKLAKETGKPLAEVRTVLSEKMNHNN